MHESTADHPEGGGEAASDEHRFLLLRDLLEEFPFFPMNVDPKNARNVEPVLEIIREYQKVLRMEIVRNRSIRRVCQ